MPEKRRRAVSYASGDEELSQSSTIKTRSKSTTKNGSAKGVDSKQEVDSKAKETHASIVTDQPKAKAKSKGTAKAKAKAKPKEMLKPTAKVKVKAKAKAEARKTDTKSKAAAAVPGKVVTPGKAVEVMKPTRGSLKRKLEASTKELNMEQLGHDSEDDDFHPPVRIEDRTKGQSSSEVETVAKRPRLVNSSRDRKCASVGTQTHSRGDLSQVLENVFQDIDIYGDGTIAVVDIAKSLGRVGLKVPENLQMMVEQIEQERQADDSEQQKMAELSGPLHSGCHELALAADLHEAVHDLPPMTPGLPKRNASVGQANQKTVPQTPTFAFDQNLSEYIKGKGVPNPIKCIMDDDSAQVKLYGNSSRNGRAVPETPSWLRCSRHTFLFKRWIT